MNRTAWRFFRLPACLLFLLVVSCASPPSHDAWVEAVSLKNLGLAYLDRNDYDNAAQAFEAAARLVPREPLGYANLAVAHLKRQEPDRAGQAIQQALDLAPDDGQILAIQADIVMATDQPEEALGILENAIAKHPADIVMRYKYLTLAGRIRGSEYDPQNAITHLRAILDYDPDNIAVLAQLAETLARAGRPSEAEPLYRTIAPALTGGADELMLHLNTTIASLHGPLTDAQRNAIILSNLLKADPAYRDSRDLLGDVSQESPPLYDFRTAPPDLAVTSADALIAMAFSSTTMLPVSGAASVAFTDYDADGFLDLAVVDGGRVRLYRNDGGAFAGANVSAGIAAVHDAIETVFGDVDNDGDQDMAVIQPDRIAMFRNEGAGTWASPTALPGRSGSPSDGVMADYDHDGDLDLLMPQARGVRFLRNAEAGRLEEAAEIPAAQVEDGGPDQDTYSRIVYGDFDLDSAIDLFVARSGGSPLLYRNGRQGKMIDWSERFGLAAVAASKTAAAGDFNNDGALDVFLGGAHPGQAVLLWNERGARFDAGSTPQQILAACRNMDIAAIAALDFDNDGFLDVAVAGSPVSAGPGLRLIRNTGNGGFADASSLLPAADTDGPCWDVKAGDYDQDGDLDLIVSTVSGVRLLRNDGGNANHWLNVKLEAALAGSGKNNYHGIGSVIEVNAQTHYQYVQVVAPVTHIGLGRRERADVYRVLWSNGAPQNTVAPASNSTVVERQRLKGSCPSLYTWNGSAYVFVTHLMTRSAIGALSETGAPAHPDAADDYVKIRGDQLALQDGRYTLRVVEELWDAVYMDRMELLVVDHPDSTDIFVDEKYTPPPYPDFAVYTAANPRLPAAAYDQHGHDVLRHLTARDSLYAGDYASGPYQGVPESHAITLDFGDLSGAERIKLYLCGWIMPIEPSANLALSQRSSPKVVAPYLEVPDADGRWRTVIPYTGFPSGEHKTMMVDLTGKFLADDYRVRITTNLQIYWSEAFITVDEPERLPMAITRLQPSAADLHFRGFSREYRVSANGPFLRDYGEVTTAPQWLPFAGYRTRYGDVAPLLEASDDRYAIYSSGEEIAVAFDARTLPALPEGWQRDFVLHTDGWLKEGDLNTQTAATIEPLPFHGMSRYPYGITESYPVSGEHAAYQRQYNTRWVSQQRAFREPFRRYGDATARIGK